MRLYNVNGYYDHLFRFLDRVAEEGYFSDADREAIHEVKNLDDIREVLDLAGSHDTDRNKLYSK